VRNYLAIHDKNFAEKWKIFVEELIESMDSFSSKIPAVLRYLKNNLI
jgi:hypothetical protein